MLYGWPRSLCGEKCHDGRASRRGDAVKGVKISFYVFSNNKDSRRLWVSRGNRRDLNLGDVTLETVLCSLHFHQRKHMQEQPLPVKFATPPTRFVGRSLGDRRFPPPSMPSAKWETKELVQEWLVKNEDTEANGKDVLVSTPARLSSLACDALRRHIFTQAATFAEQRESMGVNKDACADISRARPPVTLSTTFFQPFLRWKTFSKNPGKFKFYTGLPTSGFFTQIMKFRAEPLRGLHVRPSDGARPRGGDKKGIYHGVAIICSVWVRAYLGNYKMATAKSRTLHPSPSSNLKV